MAEETKVCYHTVMSVNFFQRIRSRLLIGLSAAFVALLIPTVAAATATTSVYTGGGILPGLQLIAGMGGIASIVSIKDLIIVIINFILNIILLIAVLAIIVAGVYLIASNGDDGQKDKAKNIILYCIAGIVLILLARVIVVFVNHIF